jgi:hypothetical protein
MTAERMILNMFSATRDSNDKSLFYGYLWYDEVTVNSMYLVS